MADMILADTSVWVAFFRNREPEASRLERTLEQRSLVTCPPVVAELAIGLLLENRDAALDPLRELPSVGLPQSAWLDAASAGRALRAVGATVPLIDLLIAVAAVRGNAELWSLDRDFERVVAVMPNLRLASV